MQDHPTAPCHGRNPNQRHFGRFAIGVTYHPIGSHVGERRGTHVGFQPMHAVRHAESFAKELVQCWTTYLDCASCFPCEADLRSDLLLTSLGGIEAAGDQEEMLHGGFAGPCPQYPGSFASFRLATYEGAKDFVPSTHRP